MKKILFTLILTFILLMSFLITNVLAVVVTEDSFKKSLTNILDTQSSLVEMDTSNDIIKFTPSNINVKYNFNDNPKFTVNLEFNINMSEDEFKVARKPFDGFTHMFSAISDHFSVDANSANLYFLAKKIKNDKLNKLMVGPSNLYTGANIKEIFDTDVSFSDELFTINSNKISDTGDTYKVQMTLTVNLNGDFSKISEYVNSTNNPTTSTKPTAKPEVLPEEVLIIPPSQNRYDVGEKLNLNGLKITAVYPNNKIEEVTKGYTVTGYNKNKEGIQTVKISYKGFSRTYEVKVGNSSDRVDFNEIEKLPQTGDFFDLKDGLYILISLLSIALIYIVYKSFKYSKNEE